MSSVGQFENRQLTVDEVLRLVATGALDDNEPVELLEGRLHTVSPQGHAHRYTIQALRSLLMSHYGPQPTVMEEKPIVVGQHSLPEPDLCVVRGTFRDYPDRHPLGNEVLWAVEVAMTSQARDRDKARIYASAEIPVYWLVDIEAQAVTVYAKPVDGRYTQVEALRGQQALTEPIGGRSCAVDEVFA